MKKLLLALVCLGFASCNDYFVTITTDLATPSYKTDSFFMLKVDKNQIWKVNDVSLLKTWQAFPVIRISGDDSSQILRGKFWVYEVSTHRYTFNGRYTDYFCYDVTNGVEAIEFEANTPDIKIGDSVYCFYQKRVCFKPKNIK